MKVERLSIMEYIGRSELPMWIELAHPLLCAWRHCWYSNPSCCSSERPSTSSTKPTSSPMTFMGLVVVLVVLRLTTIPLVLLEHVKAYESCCTTPKMHQVSVSSDPSLIYPTTAESSENFCWWQDLDLYWIWGVQSEQETWQSSPPGVNPRKHGKNVWTPPRTFLLCGDSANHCVF